MVEKNTILSLLHLWYISLCLKFHHRKMLSYFVTAGIQSRILYPFCQVKCQLNRRRELVSLRLFKCVPYSLTTTLQSFLKHAIPYLMKLRMPSCFSLSTYDFSSICFSASSQAASISPFSAYLSSITMPVRLFGTSTRISL